jgi:hypothetical protein
MLFKLFLYSTFHYREIYLYLALEDGSPLFQQVFSHCTFKLINLIKFTGLNINLF